MQPVRPSDRLNALLREHEDILTDEERLALAVAIQTATRLENGEGFTATPILSQKDGKGRVDACWMGMLAQLTPEQCRSIALGLVNAAAEAETDEALLAFYGQASVPVERAVSLVAAVRLLRSKQQGRAAVKAEAQEPSIIVPPGDARPS